MAYEKFYRTLVALYHLLPNQLLTLREQSSELTSVSPLSTSLWPLSENLPRMYSVNLTSWRRVMKMFKSHWTELWPKSFSCSDSYLVCKFFFMVLFQWALVAELIVPVHIQQSCAHMRQRLKQVDRVYVLHVTRRKPYSLQGQWQWCVLITLLPYQPQLLHLLYHH